MSNIWTHTNTCLQTTTDNGRQTADGCYTLTIAFSLVKYDLDVQTSPSEELSLSNHKEYTAVQSSPTGGVTLNTQKLGRNSMCTVYDSRGKL